MRSLSSVIKAGQVKLNGSVCRIPLYQVYPCREEEAPSPAPAQEVLPDLQIAAEAQAQAAEIIAAAEKLREEMLAAARRESEELLRQTEMQVLALEEEAKKVGYDTGYLEGMAEGQREGNRLRREGEAQLQGAVSLRRDMLERVEPQVVELAVGIAKKLVASQLEQSPESVVSIVRETLRQVREAGEVVVRVHPDDLPLCRDQLSVLQAEIRERSTLNLFADEVLARGDCRIETSGAVFECLLDERLAALRDVLLDVTGHA